MGYQKDEIHVVDNSGFVDGPFQDEQSALWQIRKNVNEGFQYAGNCCIIRILRPLDNQLASGEFLYTSPPPPEPKYKELKFKSKKLFNEWISRTAGAAIYFSGNQDLQKIIVDREGEIIDCNMQGSIWIGRFIDMQRLKTDEPVIMFIDDKWKQMDFIVEEIIT